MSPAPTTSASLPIEHVLAELRAALAESASVVLVAPPGAGKTTRVPLALLDEPWLDGRGILVLEPRRLATRAAARRMASTLGETGGATIGFSVAAGSSRDAGPAAKKRKMGMLLRWTLLYLVVCLYLHRI